MREARKVGKQIVEAAVLGIDHHHMADLFAQETIDVAHGRASAGAASLDETRSRQPANDAPAIRLVCPLSTHQPGDAPWMFTRSR